MLFGSFSVLASACAVCGFSEVQVDQVVHGSVLYLSHCPRCDHRATSSVPSARTLALRSASDAEARVGETVAA